MKLKDFIKPGDIAVYIAVAAAALISLLAFLPRDSAAFVELNDNGSVTRYPLSEDNVIEAGGDYGLRIVISGGEVYVENADCPDQVCVRTGHISRAGQVIACVPAHVTVRITGASDSAGTNPESADAYAG